MLRTLSFPVINLASILILDDMDTTRDFFESTLGDHHDLTLCENWAEAQDAFNQQDFDLVFLDCWLPDREGISVLQEIRGFYHGPLILMSGYADQSIVDDAQNYGIDGFLEKPFEPETIRETTEIALADADEIDEESTWVKPELPEDLNFHDNLRILLVDDESSTRKLFSHPFEHLDLEFRMAEDADEAWSIFQQFRPNVVILDAKLPEETTSASDFTKKIRSEEDEETFVIGITGYPESEEFKTLEKEDMVDFFYKPFPITKLLRTLSYLSFVIKKRSEKDYENVESKPPEPQDSSSNLYQKIIIGLLAILVGLSLGLAIKWTQQLIQSPSGTDMTVDEMFREIEGYLERDERREKQR